MPGAAASSANAGTFKLFIGNLDESTNASEIRALFEKYGEVCLTYLEEIAEVYLQIGSNVLLKIHSNQLRLGRDLL